jgi:hypothetical protein
MQGPQVWTEDPPRIDPITMPRDCTPNMMDRIELQPNLGAAVYKRR